MANLWSLITFTKGEWKTAYRKHEDGMYSQDVFDEKGETIATLAWHAVEITPRHITTDREANAQLIAAAPEMYQQLLRVTEWMEFNHLNEGVVGKPLYDSILELMAKAEGC